MEEEEESYRTVTICDSPEDEAQDEVTIVAEMISEGLPPALDRPTPARTTQGFADFVKNKGEDRQRQPHPVRVSKAATSESRRRGTGGTTGGARMEIRLKRFIFYHVFLQSDLKFSVK